MIKFFRRIRQKLVSENKFSKYLLYAIGEIVLVVIGILIALQVNNWNEIRKSKLDLINRLELMSNELGNDTIFYQELISGNKQRIDFLTHLSKKEYDAIDLTITTFIISKNFNPRNFGSTYYTIKESGQLNNIGNTKLKNNIEQYYENICVNFNDFSDWHKKFVAENIDNYLLDRLQLDLDGNTKNLVIIEEMDSDRLPSIVNFQAVILKRFNTLASENINQASALISQINEELKK